MIDHFYGCNFLEGSVYDIVDLKKATHNMFFCCIFFKNRFNAAF